MRANAPIPRPLHPGSAAARHCLERIGASGRRLDGPSPRAHGRTPRRKRVTHAFSQRFQTRVRQMFGTYGHGPAGRRHSTGQPLDIRSGLGYAVLPQIPRAHRLDKGAGMIGARAGHAQIEPGPNDATLELMAPQSLTTAPSKPHSPRRTSRNSHSLSEQ